MRCTNLVIRSSRIVWEVKVPDSYVAFPAVLAYLGLGSGVELLPYFVALVSFAGAALVAVVQQPLMLLIRWLRKPKETPDDDFHRT